MNAAVNPRRGGRANRPYLASFHARKRVLGLFKGDIRAVYVMRRTGQSHHRWAGGKTITKKGYVRLTAGPHRGKYEHRVVVNKLWEETYGTSLPASFEVHHMDFDRAHNCYCNLLILGPGFHEKSHADSWCHDHKGKFVGRETGVPDWVTQEVA